MPGGLFFCPSILVVDVVRHSRNCEYLCIADPAQDVEQTSLYSVACSSFPEDRRLSDEFFNVSGTCLLLMSDAPDEDDRVSLPTAGLM